MAGVTEEPTSLTALLALTEPAKHAQHTVDSTISRLEEIVVSLKRHRNSLSPIGRLPDDVLGNIFTQHCLDARSLFKYLIVTDVCFRWRSVALDTPSVWSRVVLTSASPWLVDTVLRRSKATDITIYLDGWVPDASWDVVKPHCDRIAAIILEGDAQFHHLSAPWFERRRHYSYLDEENTLFSIPASPLPTLKTFILHSPNAMSSSIDSFPSTTYLQTLDLRNAALGDWATEFPSCPMLKNLRIHFRNEARWIGVLSPARHGLIGILSQVPIIETVAFVCREPPPDDEDTAHHGATLENAYIMLPHLKELTLHIPLPEITSLLRAIRPGAPLEKIDLAGFVASRVDYQLTDVGDFIDALGSTQFSTSRLLVTASFEVHAEGMQDAGELLCLPDPPSQLHIHLWDKTPRRLADRPPEYPLSMSLTRPATQQIQEMFGVGVIHALNKHFETVVNVIANGSWTEHHWKALAHMPCISSLTFLSSTSLPFLIASFSSAGSSPADLKSSSTVSFPTLDKISVFNAVLHIGDGIIRGLAKALEARSRSGVKLSCLYFEAPEGLSQSDVDALAAIVMEVKVVFPIIEMGGKSVQLGGLTSIDT